MDLKITPQEINGWNLEMMVKPMGISFSKGPFSGSMFVLGGVYIGLPPLPGGWLVAVMKV